MNITDPETTARRAGRSRSARLALPRWWLFLSAATAVLVVGAAFALKPRSTPVSLTPRPVSPALTVTAAAPSRVVWPKTVRASGAIEPWQEAIIGAQVGGYQLASIKVNVGDAVKRGQVLASFDGDLLRAEERQLKAAVAQAHALAAQSEANHERAKRLRAAGNLSEQDFLQSHTQTATARTEVEAAAASLAAKQLQLRYADVIAPEDGTICSRTATMGAVVPIGQELFRMILKDRIEWRGELTAEQITLVEPGQRVRLSLPDGTEATAIVREKAPALDPQSRMGLVYADLEAGSHARAGMYANGEVTVSESPALVVPAASVVVRDGYSYVLKLRGGDKTTKVALQPVTVGRRQGTQTEIVQGLADGERVVVDGAGFLNDGDVVRVVQAADSDSRQAP